jgi:hypothetical protein
LSNLKNRRFCCAQFSPSPYEQGKYYTATTSSL